MQSHVTSEESASQLSSSVEQLKLTSPQHKIQRVRDELRDCTLYPGIAVICDVDLFATWKSTKNRLSAVDYKIITTDFLLHHPHTTLYSTIAQSTAYPKPPAAAESSDSPLFVIAVFVSGYASDDSVGALCGIRISHESQDIVDDIIKPFLPRSAPHLQHIPKLFFISAEGDPNAPSPHFPDDPDGNYCVAYHVSKYLIHMLTWQFDIVQHLFHPDMSVQAVIENSRSHINEDRECLHYFTCLKNNLVLDNYDCDTIG